MLNGQNCKLKIYYGLSIFRRLKVMDVFEAVRERRSIRAYIDKPVPSEKLEKILEAGCLAPSAGNIEPWHFIVVTDSEKRKILSKGRFAKFLAQAPVVIVACGDKKSSPNWFAIDVSLAVENMILTAQAEGLGTCCVGSFREAEVKQTVNAPDKYEVIVMLAVGYPKGKLDVASKFLHLMRPRKSLSDVVSEETFGKPYAAKKANGS
jgi:nitroreductase